jgi:hypothetical protein
MQNYKKNRVCSLSRAKSLFEALFSDMNQGNRIKIPPYCFIIHIAGSIFVKTVRVHDVYPFSRDIHFAVPEQSMLSVFFAE